jgi:hypothetical protein
LSSRIPKPASPSGPTPLTAVGARNTAFFLQTNLFPKIGSKSEYLHNKKRNSCYRYTLIALGSNGASGDIAGIVHNSGATSRYAEMLYNRGASAGSDFWNVRVESTDVLRISSSAITPGTDGTGRLGNATRAFIGAQFKPQSAEPTNVNLAISDGTASTNGFGGAGAGLYVKVSTTWARV